MFAEGGTSVGRQMGDDSGASGGNRRTVEVIIPKEGCMSRERRMDAGGTKEVECEDSLGKETIPLCEREGRIGGAQDGNEMVFERP
jgi:hypothetical protein